jgi:hypothetical protein
VTINNAIKDGKTKKNKKGDMWIFKRFSNMELGPDEEFWPLTRDPEARGIWRFFTSLGRTGEIMTTKKRDDENDTLARRKKLDGGVLVLREGETMCEFFPGSIGHGYKRIKIEETKEMLHRVMFEIARPELIAAKVAATGIPWKDLIVDHIIAANVENGELQDNRLDNLQVLTEQEHQDKNAKPIVEIDANGIRIPGQSWISASEASRELSIHQGNISAVCREFTRTTCYGRRFKLVADLDDEMDREAALAEANAKAEAQRMSVRQGLVISSFH